MHDRDLKLGSIMGAWVQVCAHVSVDTAAIHALQTPTTTILGDPGADSGGEGKSKRAAKYGTKKSKERREEPLGTMSCQTSSKRSLPFWLLIGARKLVCFSAQSEGRTAATVWN